MVSSPSFPLRERSALTTLAVHNRNHLLLLLLLVLVAPSLACVHHAGQNMAVGHGQALGCRHLGRMVRNSVLKSHTGTRGNLRLVDTMQPMQKILTLRGGGEAGGVLEEEDEMVKGMSKMSTAGADGPKKESVNLVMVGHVDAGKSTISGHLMYLTGMLDERTLDKFARESEALGRSSWKFAWAMDLTEEEREKGKTQEVGQACIDTEARRYTLLDAPGHKNFVPNMIGGAVQAELAILVISARKGEFEVLMHLKRACAHKHVLAVCIASLSHHHLTGWLRARRPEPRARSARSQWRRTPRSRCRQQDGRVRMGRVSLHRDPIQVESFPQVPRLQPRC
jgi:hypothetical protein